LVTTSEMRDGMQVDWNVAVPMDDGTVLRADVFRPPGDAPAPVILSYGPYAKGLTFADGYASAWERMVREHPDVTAGSSNAYQNWEVVDPEKWVPHGYACVRVDSRGAGCSPGFLDPWSPQETRDLVACIAWAAAQSWSTGNVGLNGISYFAMNQWTAAAHAPPNLKAICTWEGAADFYRDVTHHGGILCTFAANWYDMQVKSVQYGLGERGGRSRLTGEPICGDVTLDDAQLEANRVDFGAAIRSHSIDDAYHRDRSPHWPAVHVPLLSAANWGGQGLHPRGNFEGFTQAASVHKWLEVHGIEHWTEFYTAYGVALQKRFFDYFLKGENNGWDQQPRVQLQVRHLDRFVQRAESEWPLARTHWTRLYLSPEHETLGGEPPTADESRSFAATGEGLTFFAPPLDAETEITGPCAAKLFVSSSTADADLFVILRAFSPANDEVVFQGAIDPHTPLAQGWLRASHRTLDEARTLPYRPCHTHDDPRPLSAEEVVELDIEIWPTSIVLPAGYRLAFTVRGSDYEYPGPSGGRLSNFKNELRGCGPFLHDDPLDRPPAVFGGRTTLHAGWGRAPYLLLPIVPGNSGD
jgi:uncharacterized protein